MEREATGDMADQLRAAIRASGRSLFQLGQLAGVDHSRLSRFLRGERDLTLAGVVKLCSALGLKLCQAEPAGGGGRGPEPADASATAAAKDVPPADRKPAQHKPKSRKAPRPRGS